MILEAAVQQVLLQLKSIITPLNTQQYSTPITAILKASIGAHTRHIIEFFQELIIGYDKGIINYDLRIRNKAIENNIQTALDCIDTIINNLKKPDIQLEVVNNYIANNNKMLQTKSSYYREIAYNIEHTVHHLAIIRIALQFLQIDVSEEVGFADATLKKNIACAQ